MTFPFVKEHFLILSDAIALSKTYTSALGTLWLLQFPPLRWKKVFILKFLAGAHNLTLELPDEVRTLRLAFVVINGNEAVPQQDAINNAVHVATLAARYAAEHIVVASPC
jgi:hypothetical protein